MHILAPLLIKSPPFCPRQTNFLLWYFSDPSCWYLGVCTHWGGWLDGGGGGSEFMISSPPDSTILSRPAQQIWILNSLAWQCGGRWREVEECSQLSDWLWPLRTERGWEREREREREIGAMCGLFCSGAESTVQYRQSECGSLAWIMC